MMRLGDIATIGIGHGQTICKAAHRRGLRRDAEATGNARRVIGCPLFRRTRPAWEIYIRYAAAASTHDVANGLSQTARTARLSRGSRRSDRRWGRQEACVAFVTLYATRMATTIKLRACPYCASENLSLATLDSNQLQFVAVTCSGCGAMGPRANVTDPAGHAEFLWNQRFGLLLSIGPLRRR